MTQTSQNSSTKVEVTELKWDKACINHLSYKSNQYQRKETQEKKDNISSFHRALNTLDSSLMLTQTSGDTISTTKDALTTAAKTTSILGQTLLGIGDPLMMLSIGLRAAFGFVRALIDKGIEARKTRLATSFLNLSLATLAVVIVFGVIAAAPAFSIPLCLLGATLFGYYSDHQVITEKQQRLEKAQNVFKTTPIGAQIYELLSQKNFLLTQYDILTQTNPAKALEAFGMIDTINTEIKDLCYHDHVQRAHFELNENIITCMTRSRNARMIGALGIVLIIASIFTFPPLALAGFTLFITAGIVNGVIRRQQYQYENKYYQATHDQSAVSKIQKKYHNNYYSKLKYHESEALIEADLKENQRKHLSLKQPLKQKTLISHPHPSNEILTQTLSEGHISLFDHTQNKQEEDEGEGEHPSPKSP